MKPFLLCGLLKTNRIKLLHKVKNSKGKLKTFQK